MRQSALGLGVFLSLIVGTVGACGEDTLPIPPAGELKAGAAEVRMPAPVGIGTVGYGGFGVKADPSPFANIYPPTKHVHGAPSFKAVAISRGPGNEVIFLRGDMVGTFQQFRRAIAQEVEKRIGRSIDDALLMAGTHSHSGPGRVLAAGGVFDIIADTFFPEHYQRMVDAAASAIVNALDDLQPARIGHTWATCMGGHKDRRCEDGRDYTNDRMPVIAVERQGKIDAVVFAYAAHGTVLTIDDLTLSADASGSMEAHVQAGFDHPVMALFFNSWGADMAPGDPDLPLSPSPMQPHNYEQLLKVGRVVADSVHAALPQIAWETTPTLYAEIHRVPLDREVIGYQQGQFPFEWGGIFCQNSAVMPDCTGMTRIPDLDQTCVPFPQEQPAPMQTEFSAGRIGELRFVTWPGESGTLLAEELLKRFSDKFNETNVALFGYTQDYTGYSILEDDWWHGGYEASGAIWGPRQGMYLLDRAEGVFKRAVADGRGHGPEDDAPQPLPAFQAGTFTPFVATPPDGLGMIVADAQPSYTVTDLVSVTVNGSDPWLGTPVATLVDEAGDPVKLGSGQNVTSDGYAFWVDLVPVPSYKDEPKAASRAFQWTFNLPAQLPIAGVAPPLKGGKYKLRVELPAAGGPMTVDSAVFTVN